MPLQSAMNGEGIAEFTTPEQILFEWPPRRYYAQTSPPPPPKKSSVVSQDPASVPISPPQLIAPGGFWLGAFVLTLDLSWLREDEAVSLSALVRMTDGDPPLLLFSTTLERASQRSLWQSRPIYSLYGCVFSATQIKGAGDVRLPWWVVQVDAPAKSELLSR